jgi:hypothetical protein
MELMQLLPPSKIKLASSGYTVAFYNIFKEEKTPMLLKLYHKIERKGMLSNSISEASITLISKSDKDIIKTIDQFP